MHSLYWFELKDKLGNVWATVVSEPNEYVDVQSLEGGA